MSQTLPHIELYVRSLFPGGDGTWQDAVVERLDDLERAGEIAGYDIVVWGTQIAPDSAAADSEAGRYILNRVAEFEQWALSNNVSLGSFDQRTAVEPEGTDAMVLPVMRLAEYEGAELAHVAPYAKGETVHTISDRLDSLETGDPSAFDREAADAPLV